MCVCVCVCSKNQINQLLYEYSDRSLLRLSIFVPFLSVSQLSREKKVKQMGGGFVASVRRPTMTSTSSPVQRHADVACSAKAFPLLFSAFSRSNFEHNLSSSRQGSSAVANCYLQYLLSDIHIHIYTTYTHDMLLPRCSALPLAAALIATMTTTTTRTCTTDAFTIHIMPSLHKHCSSNSSSSSSTVMNLSADSWDSASSSSAGAGGGGGGGGSGQIEQIEFKIFPDGRVEETVRGVKGNNCHKVTEKINEALGEVVASQPTEEMFEQEVTGDQTLYNTNGGGSSSSSSSSDSWEGSSSW